MIDRETERRIKILRTSEKIQAFVFNISLFLALYNGFGCAINLGKLSYETEGIKIAELERKTQPDYIGLGLIGANMAVSVAYRQKAYDERRRLEQIDNNIRGL